MRTAPKDSNASREEDKTASSANALIAQHAPIEKESWLISMKNLKGKEFVTLVLFLWTISLWSLFGILKRSLLMAKTVYQEIWQVKC